MSGSAILLQDGRIREFRYVPDWGMPYGDLEGFIAMLKSLTEGLDRYWISWHHAEEQGTDDSLFIMGDRDRTPEDEAWLRASKDDQDERDRRDIDYLQKRVDAPFDDWEATLGRGYGTSRYHDNPARRLAL